MYSLADSADGFFSIDSSSGIIILEQSLDREQQSSYNISVQATDQSPGQSLSSFTTVTITVLDINDNPPVFERRDYLVTVPEDTSPGTQVLAVFATSKDIGTNAEITYLIRSGNEQGKFRINPKTGGSIATSLEFQVSLYPASVPNSNHPSWWLFFPTFLTGKAIVLVDRPAQLFRVPSSTLLLRLSLPNSKLLLLAYLTNT
jgi:hypothetical protein